MTAPFAAPSVVELIMERIRDAIVRRLLQPGERYSADKVAELLGLGVSRTPVREAMARLANVGMVRLERNRGIRIVEANTGDIRDLFQLRLMVEVPATFRAVQRHVDAELIYRLETELAAMDQAAKATIALASLPGGEAAQFMPVNEDFLRHDILFHKLLIERSNNARLVASVNQWRDVITAQRGWQLSEPRDLLGLYDEHEQILQAARERDPYAAAQAMYEHLVNTGTRALEELQCVDSDSDPFDPLWYEGIPEPSQQPSRLEKG
jgi:DNA-binding GntR family transcriptional regulator